VAIVLNPILSLRLRRNQRLSFYKAWHTCIEERAGVFFQEIMNPQLNPAKNFRKAIKRYNEKLSGK
jgi:hypothetical protein